MSRPLPSRRWLQFRLRSLLLLVFLVAIALSGWQYWRQTRHMWRLQWAIAQRLPRSPEEAKLLRQLVWDRDAWESGLIDAVWGRVPDGTYLKRALYWERCRPRLWWTGEFVDERASTHRLHLFEGGSFGHPMTSLTCVVTDSDGRFETWQELAERSFEFTSASIEKGTPPILHVRCKPWFTGSIHCRYTITNKQLSFFDEVECDDDAFTW